MVNGPSNLCRKCAEDTPTPEQLQLYEDLVITALEGGSNYWYYLPDLSMVPKDKTTPLSILIFRAAMNGARIPVSEAEDPEHILGYLTKDGMLTALDRLSRGEGTPIRENGKVVRTLTYGNQVANIVDGNWDANSADVWFQMAVMGEVIYG